ncbi:MAG: hypothetical protein WC375_05435 [Methanomassiliicoccales archaeon]|jgi:hypothetical protein
MIFKITKTCIGTIDTSIERKRILKAFKNDPETKEELTKLMDAIESQNWELAEKLLNSKWWQGQDEKRECPRYEFIGFLNVTNITDQSRPANGFSMDGSYADLVFAMCESTKQIHIEKITS